jgi:hypothetical protein
MWKIEKAGSQLRPIVSFGRSSVEFWGSDAEELPTTVAARSKA